MGRRKQAEPEILRIWESMDNGLARGEGALLVLGLALMVLLSVAQIVLRNFFSSGILWFDPLVRHLLLVMGFLGASIATRKRQHITVDALSKFFRGKGLHLVNILLGLSAAIICGFLAKAAFDFVLATYQSGERIHETVPTWIAQAVLPYAFSMMSLRFAVSCGTDVWRMTAGLPALQASAHGNSEQEGA